MIKGIWAAVLLVLAAPIGMAAAQTVQQLQLQLLQPLQEQQMLQQQQLLLLQQQQQRQQLLQQQQQHLQ
jgi:hypothetical protein